MRISDKKFFLTSDLVRRIVVDGELYISIADFYAYTDILIPEQQAVLLPFEWGGKETPLSCVLYKDIEHLI